MTNAISTGAAGRQRGDFTLAIDDQRASELYARFDMATAMEQEQYRNALRNWAEQKVAQQQSATYDELQKVYEDVGAWWKDSGGNDAPDEVRYGAANRKFIAHQLQTTAREMGDLYPTYRDQWFLKTFRKQPKTETEAFNTIRDMLAAQKQADETLVASGGQVALAAWEGKDPIAAVPDIVQSIKDANPEIAASLHQGAEAAWIKTLYDETKKTADVLQKHGDTARQLYDLMVERTGAEVDNKSANAPITREESDALVDKLGEMSDEELDTVFTAIVAAAKASGMDEKTFWQQVGEANFSRFFNIFRSGGSQEPAAYDRLKYLENAEQVLRPATDEERGAGQTDQRFAGTRFAALDRATAQVPMSEEERQQEIAKARKDLRRAEIYNKLIDLADNKFDPIQKKFSGLAGLAESVAYYGPQALMTSVATRIPAGIGPALMTYGIYQSEYRAMRQQGYSVEEARTLATYSAPFQMMVEYVSGGILLGRNKGVEDFLKRMANPAKAGAARRFGTRVAVNWPVEVAEESIQNFTTDGIQEALSALGEEYPDVDWEGAWTQYWDELPEIAAISLFPVMVAGGVLTFTDARSEKQRIEAFRQGGMSEEDIAEIRDSATVEEEVEKFRTKFWELDPARAERGRAYIRGKIAERDRERATGWTVDIEAGKGGQPTTYIVRDETGRVRLTTNDQTAADQIIVEESRRSVQAQFEQKTQELKEFVGWWLNEDPKRKDNEQRVAKDKQVTTAQQKLEILQQAGNAQGIEELHRRIAQSPYAGTPYDQIFILGEASVEQVGEMVFRSVIALNPNSDLRSAREEMHHTAVRIAAANGTVDEQTMRGWLEATERVFAEKGLGITLPRADMTDIVESMAVVQEAFENERISADVEMSLPQAFVAYIKRMVEVFVEVLKRGKAIREALDAGVLPAEFEAFLAETTGVADQTIVNRARERTEQEVVAGQNYSIGVASQQDADYLAAVERGDMETAQRMVDEAAKRAGYNVGPVYHGRRTEWNVADFQAGKMEGDIPAVFFTDNTQLAEEYSATRFGPNGVKLIVEKDKAENVLQELLGATRFNNYDGRLWDRMLSDLNRADLTNEQYRAGLEAIETLEAAERYDNRTDGTPNVLSAFLKGEPVEINGNRLPMSVLEDAVSQQIRNGAELVVVTNTTDPSAPSGNTATSTVYVVADSSNQIKSADPVTYDAQGNVIPLSQRFDPTTPNINYSIVRSVEHFKNDTRFDKLVEDGRVFTGVDVNDFIDQHILLHSPDNAFAGTIQLTDGGEIKGKGGVYYPALYADDNYFWASTEAMVMRTANHLNEIGAKNGGRVLMGLVSAPVEKLFSSTSMSTGVVKFLNALTNDPRAGLRKSDLNAMLVAASKVEVVVQTKTKTTKKTFSTKLKASDSYATNFGKIDELLAPDGSIFQVRKAFVESLAEQVSKHLNATKANAAYVAGILADAENKHAKSAIKRGTLSKASFLQGLGNMLTEPFLRDFQEHGSGKIYAIVEVRGKVKGIATTEHESYPATIVPVNKRSKVKLHVLKEAVDWQDVVGKDSGEYATPQERLNLLPTSGMSSTNLKVLGVKTGTAGAPLNYSIAAKNSLRVRMTRQALTDAALAQASWKDWYEEHQAVLDEFFGKYAQLFQDILSITSQAASVKANVGLALRAFGLYVRGEPFDGMLRGEEKRGFLPAVIKNLERHRENDQLQGQKIRAYKASNDGEVDQAVVDRHIAQLIFGVKSPSKAQFAKAQKILSEIANEIGWTPRQVQAALWAHSIYKSGKTPESYGDYLKKLEARGTIEQRIGDLGRRGTGGNADGRGRGRYAPTGAAEGAGVDNYSISTQSEIDRVQAAMGALDRSPLDTLEITEKLRKRFASIMAENMVELAAMRQGGVAEREVLDEEGNPIGPQPDAPRTKATGAEIRRTKLLQALGELDGLLSALPPQVAAKVGGYTVLTNIGTGDRALSNFFIKRLEMIDKELERYLKDRYTKALEQLFQRAKPKQDAAGKVPQGKLGASVHALFDQLKLATKKTVVEVDGEVTSLEQQVASGELSIEEEAMKGLLADVLPLFASWQSADASRMAQAVQAGFAILQKAYKKQRELTQIKRNQQEERRLAAKESTGITGDIDEAINKQQNIASKRWQQWKALNVNLFGFDQLISFVFGRDSKITKEIVNAQRKADNAKADELIGVWEEWQEILASLGGITDSRSMTATHKGQDIVYELSQPSVKIKHTNMEGQEIELEFSQNQLITITMMWMQPKGRAHMMGKLDSDGNPIGDWHYDQDFINRVEAKLKPEARAIRRFLLRKYAEEWKSINDVFVRLRGINMPQEDFYSPLGVDPVMAIDNKMLADPSTGFALAAPNRTPPALRSRGAAVAKPKFQDAVQVYFAHRRQMAHWKAYAEFNSDMLSVLGHRNTRNVVEAKGGVEALNTLNKWLTYMTQGGNIDAAAGLALHAYFNGVMGRVASFILFGRIVTVAIQFTQLGAAAAKMPFPAYVKQMAKLLSGKLSWADSYRSPYIQRRVKEMPPQVQLAMEGIMANKPSYIAELARRAGWYISGSDGLWTSGTYAMIYDYKLQQAKKAGFTGAEAERIAREEAERDTDEVAQPTRMGARSAFEATMTNPLAKSVWAFSSEARKNYAINSYLWFSNSPAAQKRQAIYYTLVISSAMATILRTIARDIRDDEDDEWFDEKNWDVRRMALMMATDFVYGFPVIGEMAEETAFRLFGEYRPQGSVLSVGDAPVALSRMPQHILDTLNGEGDPDRIVKDVNRIMQGAGLFARPAASAAVLSNIAKDLYEFSKPLWKDDE